MHKWKSISAYRCSESKNSFFCFENIAILRWFIWRAIYIVYCVQFFLTNKWINNLKWDFFYHSQLKDTRLISQIICTFTIDFTKFGNVVIYMPLQHIIVERPTLTWNTFKIWKSSYGFLAFFTFNINRFYESTLFNHLRFIYFNHFFFGKISKRTKFRQLQYEWISVKYWNSGL